MPAKAWHVFFAAWLLFLALVIYSAVGSVDNVEDCRAAGGRTGAGQCFFSDSGPHD